MNVVSALSCPSSATLGEMAAPAQRSRRDDEDLDHLLKTTGPLRARDIRDGDPYELSNGHPIRCMGAGERHGGSNARGAQVLSSDPKAAQNGGAGVDVAYEFNDGKNLRAPDISVGNLKGRPGWAKGVPALAVEYADRGQDERELRRKIGELLAAGTQHLWVVRLVGELRVEVHRPGKRMLVVGADGVLKAPGVLQNPVPVRALVDQGAANQATLRNILNQHGYESMEALREEGREEGRDEGRLAEARSALVDLCEGLDIPLSAARRARIGGLDLDGLRSLRQEITRLRAWPPRQRASRG